MGAPRWTAEEDEVMRQHYENLEMCELRRLLPKRSRYGILRRGPFLGLVRSIAFREKTQFEKKHGKTHSSKAYKVWCSMRRRCMAPSHKSWSDYGGRGITICERWNEFENFLQDMGEPPPNTTIGRIDNAKGYSPDNCRWETMEEQNNNRRSSLFLTAFGQTKTMSQWAKELGLKQATLQKRISVKKWPVEKALTQPLRKVRPYVHWLSGKEIES